MVVLTRGYTWQQALGANFISGVFFFLLSFVGLREQLINVIPATLKNAIAVGIGLLIAVVGLQWSGMIVDNPGTLPRARWDFLSDAVGTTVGFLLGTSTVTSYVESATGISAGARTGLANMTTGSLLLVAIFFTPLVGMIAGGIDQGEGLVLYPVVALVLIIVGCYMLRQVKRIDWNNFAEAIPAFMTILIMPMTFSITEGISFGFISYALLRAVTGRFTEVPLLIWVFVLSFILRYFFSILLTRYMERRGPFRERHRTTTLHPPSLFARMPRSI